MLSDKWFGLDIATILPRGVSLRTGWGVDTAPGNAVAGVPAGTASDGSVYWEGSIWTNKCSLSVFEKHVILPVVKIWAHVSSITLTLGLNSQLFDWTMICRFYLTNSWSFAGSKFHKFDKFQQKRQNPNLHHNSTSGSRATSHNFEKYSGAGIITVLLISRAADRFSFCEKNTDRTVKKYKVKFPSLFLLLPRIQCTLAWQNGFRCVDFIFSHVIFADCTSTSWVRTKIRNQLMSKYIISIYGEFKNDSLRNKCNVQSFAERYRHSCVCRISHPIKTRQQHAWEILIFLVNYIDYKYMAVRNRRNKYMQTKSIFWCQYNDITW